MAFPTPAGRGNFRRDDKIAWTQRRIEAAGEVDHAAVEKGIAYLCATQAKDGLWEEERFTATGFPRVFYLRYHG
jgi:squalene-hopene/tetraprenyl-beta-curcumene cyclase